MNDELGEPMQVEMLAASLRASSTDLKAFMEALAVKLEGSLRGMFSREHPVKEVTVNLGNFQYRISRERQGPLLTQRAKVVRGIVLKTDQISMDQWINELAQGLAEEAVHSAQARSALEQFLL